MKRAGTRARWSLVFALSIAAVAFLIAGASAAGPGGWDHLGDFKTPKAASLNGAVYALSAESDNGLLVGGNFNFTTADGRPAAHLAVWYPTQFWTPTSASSFVEWLRAVAERHRTTPGAVAVAWTLRNPAVDGAIVGFRRPDQVDPILAAAGLELNDADLAEIEGATR